MRHGVNGGGGVESHPSALSIGGATIDTITLTGLTVFGYHGVFPEERRDGQEFIIDVELSLPIETESDDLANTVNYAELASAVAGIVAGEPVNLIETLAGRIAKHCLAEPKVAAVTVTVHKPQAPVSQSVTDLSVTIHRSKHA